MPWCFINPSFYFGPGATRAIERDYAPHVAPLRSEYWHPLVQGADLVLHATDAVLGWDPVDLPPGHRYIGLQSWEPPGAVPAYLDEPGDPWMLATLSLAPQAGELRVVSAALGALAGRSLRALITVKGARRRRDIRPVPPNVRLEDYVPHSKVLGRAHLLLCHAGHGSVIKALYHGVPMVLVPIGRDQPGVAARAEKLGVARVVTPTELDARTLGSAIDEVLNDPQYRERAQTASRHLRGTDGAQIACCAIEELASRTAHRAE